MDVGQLEAEVKKTRGFYMPEIQICGKPKIKYQIGDVFFQKYAPLHIFTQKWSWHFNGKKKENQFLLEWLW